VKASRQGKNLKLSISHSGYVSADGNYRRWGDDGVCAERRERGGPCWLLKLRWMRTLRGQMKGVLSWLVLWACRARYKRFLFCLSCSSRPSTKYFFPHRTLFQFLWSPSPSKLGSGQEAVPGCLSLMWVSGCAYVHGVYTNKIYCFNPFLSIIVEHLSHLSQVIWFWILEYPGHLDRLFFDCAIGYNDLDFFKENFKSVLLDRCKIEF
jgi:hypothetical protein